MPYAASFTAVDQYSNEVSIKHLDVLSTTIYGSFVATVKIQRTTNGGASWEFLPNYAATTTSTDLQTVEHPGGGSATYRLYCTSYTSGTVSYSIGEGAKTLHEFTDTNGRAIVRIKEDGLYVLDSAGNNIISAKADALTVANSSGTAQFVAGTSGVTGVARTSQQYTFSAANAKAGATAGWVVGAGDNIALSTCPQSQTGSTLVVPVGGFKVGSTITAFSLVGQIESGGNAVTVDAALRKMTAAAADVADASVGAITQVSASADAIISASKSGLSEVVAADESFYVLITATTGASCDIALQAVTVTVTEA